MKLPENDLLLTAGKVLALLFQGIMALGGVALVFAMVGALFFGDAINAELRTEFGAATTDLPTVAVLGLLSLALVAVVLIFVFFGKLRGIIATVAEGDPFVPENADRLTAMAWLMLAVYLLVGVASFAAAFVIEWASQFEEMPLTGTLGFDLSSLMLIVTLFILARVFRHGAVMREDLEGTV
jgi:hypothetical protein